MTTMVVVVDDDFMCRDDNKDVYNVLLLLTPAYITRYRTTYRRYNSHTIQTSSLVLL